MRCGCSSIRSTASHAARSPCTEAFLGISGDAALVVRLVVSRTLRRPHVMLHVEFSGLSVVQHIALVGMCCRRSARLLVRWLYVRFLATCVMTSVSGQASRHVSDTQSKASSASADVVAALPVWTRLEAGSKSPASSASSGSPASDDSCAAAHQSTGLHELQPHRFRCTCLANAATLLCAHKQRSDLPSWGV